MLTQILAVLLSASPSFLCNTRLKPSVFMLVLNIYLRWPFVMRAGVTTAFGSMSEGKRGVVRVLSVVSGAV